jgi:hypothetical protein
MKVLKRNHLMVKELDGKIITGNYELQSTNKKNCPRTGSITYSMTTQLIRTIQQPEFFQWNSLQE